MVFEDFSQLVYLVIHHKIRNIFCNCKIFWKLFLIILILQAEIRTKQYTIQNNKKQNKKKGIKTWHNRNYILRL